MKFTKPNFEPATEDRARQNSVNPQLVNPLRPQAKHTCERFRDKWC